MLDDCTTENAIIINRNVVVEQNNFKLTFDKAGNWFTADVAFSDGEIAINKDAIDTYNAYMTYFGITGTTTFDNVDMNVSNYAVKNFVTINTSAGATTPPVGVPGPDKKDKSTLNIVNESNITISATEGDGDSHRVNVFYSENDPMNKNAFVNVTNSTMTFNTTTREFQGLWVATDNSTINVTNAQSNTLVHSHIDLTNNSAFSTDKALWGGIDIDGTSQATALKSFIICDTTIKEGAMLHIGDFGGYSDDEGGEHHGTITVEPGASVFADSVSQDDNKWINLSIASGYYKNEVNADFIADGYKCVENTDGTTKEVYPWTIGEDKTYAAQIGDNKYESLEAAVNAAEDGDTITLLANNEDKITVSKVITFNVDDEGYDFEPGNIAAGSGYVIERTAVGTVTTFAVTEAPTPQPTPTPQPDPTPQPINNGGGTTIDVSKDVKVNTDASGKVVAKTEVTADTAKNIVETAEKNKSEEVVISAVAPSTSAQSGEVTKTEVSVPADAIAQLAKSETVQTVVIQTDVAEFTMDKETIKELDKQSGAGATIKVEAVRMDEKSQAENQDVYELKIVAVQSGSETVISNFKGGTVTVKVKTPEGLNGKKVACLYRSNKGVLTRRSITKQNDAQGWFSFTTDHFSDYIVTEESVAQKMLVNQTAVTQNKAKAYKGRKIKVTVKRATWDKELGKKTATYQIYRSTKKSSGFKRVKTVTSKKATVTYTNKKLKKGKTYYYKVRAKVKLANGEYAYTKWSKVQKAKAK